ncbi:MAG: signal peptide peptidase SppA [Alphaproteobacteria bacterium]|nr:signal peptide peptidase SppA [Alphaproteobacteria bacterium]MCZ6764082.1 signal peptide peptidase SppA [Alphaproteobacteria bacterium]
MSDTDLRRQKRKLRFWRIFGAVAVVVALIALLPDAERARRAHIARLTVTGIIVQDEPRNRLLQALTETKARALIVHIDSPGGTVVGGEDLYRGLEAVREKIPVATVMGTVAASGGYMAALSGDRIFAREGTVTGSIGVMMQTTDLTGLLDRIGITAEAIKSSPLKAQPSPLEPLTREGRDAIQAVIDDMYVFFVGLVAERRGLELEAAQALSDGRVYTGRQALAVGLIDEIGAEPAAIAWFADARGIDADLPVVDIEAKKERDLIGRIIDRLAGKSLISNTLTLDGLVSLWQPKLQ